MSKIYDKSLVTVGLLALPLHLTELIFALIGVFSKKTKKGFPVAGIVLGSIFGLIAIAVLAIRMLMSIGPR